MEPGAVARPPEPCAPFRHKAGVAKSALEQGAEKILGGSRKFFLGYSAARFGRKPADLHEYWVHVGVKGRYVNKVVF